MAVSRWLSFAAVDEVGYTRPIFNLVIFFDGSYDSRRNFKRWRTLKSSTRWDRTSY